MKYNYKSTKNNQAKESQIRKDNDYEVEFRNIDRDMNQPTESDIAEIDLYAKKCVL